MGTFIGRDSHPSRYTLINLKVLLKTPSLCIKGLAFEFEVCRDSYFCADHCRILWYCREDLLYVVSNDSSIKNVTSFHCCLNMIDLRIFYSD